MKKFLASLIMAVVPGLVLAAGPSVPLDKIKPDLTDQASLQRGAALFSNYCMGCHSAKYARYERIATDLGIPVELYEENLIFNGAKPGELMNIAMSPALAKGWFGAPPPDLTLEARLRGPNWVYSYMRAFYADDSRPFGVNNVVFPSVGMPHVLVGLQGLCAEPPKVGVSGRVEPLSGTVVDQGGCQSWAIEGSMTPAEYDQAMFDLTNFLVYLGEPMQLERKRIGMYVLIFLAILFVFAYLLNREYWKDVH